MPSLQSLTVNVCLSSDARRRILAADTVILRLIARHAVNHVDLDSVIASASELRDALTDTLHGGSCHRVANELAYAIVAEYLDDEIELRVEGNTSAPEHGPGVMIELTNLYIVDDIDIYHLTVVNDDDEICDLVFAELEKARA